MWEFVNALVDKAQSELFLFLILSMVLLFLIVRPLYLASLKAREISNNLQITREGKILDVVQGNSSVMMELKTLIQSSNDNCRVCRSDHISHFARMEEKQDSAAIVLGEIKNNTQRS